MYDYNRMNRPTVPQNALVSSTILNQLGGNKFRVMTGAKGFIYGANYLAFRIPFPSINEVRITLNALDLYDIEFRRVRGAKITLVKSYDNVYADQLQSVFSEATGLATHL